MRKKKRQIHNIHPLILPLRFRQTHKIKSLFSICQKGLYIKFPGKRKFVPPFLFLDFLVTRRNSFNEG